MSRQSEPTLGETVLQEQTKNCGATQSAHLQALSAPPDRRRKPLELLHPSTRMQSAAEENVKVLS